MSAAVHLIHDGMLLFLLLISGLIALVKPVAGSSLALCEGGQTCLPPKECCAQGCCYLYAPPGAPRVPMANNDHVLSLLFVNHWYFWCFVLAIVLALLCTCSLWKKRRQLCGWDTSARHSQSEGDSAGSCYAPPQYSRCNSFHIHAPPPYTEVASKPDLYPLVFSYTDPGKGNGANYLMVQYFRNYIVQPVGSISGTSTVDSLSSSFICNANEANTLVPPPYSRAASPDLTMSFRNYLMPRSASQQVCLTAFERSAGGAAQTGQLQGSRSQASYQRDDDSLLDQHQQQQHCILSREQQRDETGPVDGTLVTSTINHTSISSNNVSLMECPESERGAGSYHPRRTNFMDHGPTPQTMSSSTSAANNPATDTSGLVHCAEQQRMVAGSTESFTSLPGPPFEVGQQAHNSNSIHPANRYTGHLDGTSDNCDLNILQATFDHQRNTTLVCKLCCSMGDITAGTPADRRSYHTKDLSALHKSLETCCHVNLHGNRDAPRLSSLQPTDSDDSMLHTDAVRKHDARMRNSCGVSSVGSNVSSLVNLDASSSPPRATSPTAEVRELLEQIRLLHSDGTDVQGAGSTGLDSGDVQLFDSDAPQQRPSGTEQRPPGGQSSYRRPSSLIGRRTKLWSKPATQPGGSRGMYIPISFTQSFMAPGTSGRHLRSPASMSSAASSFLNRGRSRYCWLSKSAPTTPGAAPGSFAGGTLSDNRPLLLTEQEEDGEQNV
ncbi:uncharacterized protein LOC128709261 [Anopheles marshallii]|uniref:uncharacterized protein LOC128709261 n=1 Tax=Anopheles marshallii TaxID=1521116 RepID=UPI00237A600E|nr:uncharacterized protein LOC128709261 [Anopheles marshallii]